MKIWLRYLLASPNKGKTIPGSPNECILMTQILLQGNKVIQSTLIDKTCALKVWRSGYKPTLCVSDGDHNETYDNGPTYLKILISRINIDSRSTVTYIRSTLLEIYKHMSRLDGDVTKFKELFRLHLKTLKARGESSNDIMLNLFKGYNAISDAQLKNFRGTMGQSNDCYASVCFTLLACVWLDNRDITNTQV